MKQTTSVVLLALLSGTKAIQTKQRLTNRGVFSDTQQNYVSLARMEMNKEIQQAQQEQLKFEHNDDIPELSEAVANAYAEPEIQVPVESQKVAAEPEIQVPVQQQKVAPESTQVITKQSEVQKPAAEPKKQQDKKVSVAEKKNSNPYNLIRVDDRPLWQQHREEDDDSFGAYSSMISTKADSYDDDQEKQNKAEQMAQNEALKQQQKVKDAQKPVVAPKQIAAQTVVKVETDAEKKEKEAENREKMFNDLLNSENDQQEDQAISDISKMFKTDDEVGQEIQDSNREEMHQLVPQELQAIRNGQFDKMMQNNAMGNHTEQYDYLNQPAPLSAAQTTDEPAQTSDNLTTLEKDLDHPSPLKNPQRAYGADAPLSAVQKTSVQALVTKKDVISDQVTKSVNSNLTTTEKGVVSAKVVPVADLKVNQQKGYSAEESSNAQGTAAQALSIIENSEAQSTEISEDTFMDDSYIQTTFVDQEGQGEPYIQDIMSSNLSFIERGGVPPKTVPVADLVINPQRAYAADAPSNAELTQFVDEVGQGSTYVNDVASSNLSLREKGAVAPKVVPVADLVINPQRGYSAYEPSNAILAQVKGELRFVNEVGQGSDYVNDVASSNLSSREKGALPPKVVPVADLVINPKRGYSAYEPSNAILAQVKGELRFVDEVGQGSDYVNDVASSSLSLREKGALPPKVVPVADLVINPQRAYAADAPSNAELAQIY